MVQVHLGPPEGVVNFLIFDSLMNIVENYNKRRIRKEEHK